MVLSLFLLSLRDHNFFFLKNQLYLEPMTDKGYLVGGVIFLKLTPLEWAKSFEVLACLGHWRLLVP
jgi:hypothetical protein